MQSLADKLTAIEATGVLKVDLSWLNANYQRALFHYVRKCSADRLREVARPRRLAALVLLPQAELSRRRRSGGGHVRQVPHPDSYTGRA